MEDNLPVSGCIQRVLLVDDSRLQRRILAASLKKWGFEVVQAEGGEEALDICRAEPPDLIISDWLMPGLSGVEFCRALREEETDFYIYFLMLTSKSDKNEVAEALDAGADDFMTKPVNSDELRARISAGERILSVQRALFEKDRIYSPGNVNSEFHEKKKRIVENRAEIFLVARSILLQATDFREQVRIRNDLDPDLRESTLLFLDRILSDSEVISDLLFTHDTNLDESVTTVVASRFDRFKSAFSEEFGKYFAIEAVSRTAVPGGLILACGALGGLVGGPFGFGAGSVFGQFLTGQLKAGAMVDRMAGRLSDEN